MEDRFAPRLQEMLDSAVCHPEVTAGTLTRLHEFLRPYAEQVIAENRQGFNRHVTLQGTTARSGTREYQVELAKRRAEVVKRLLVDLGVPGDLISTEGLGSYNDYYEPDNSSTGHLLPGPAARNRSVIVRLICG